MSDPLLTTCPECKHATYKKQVTAAGFKLKGSGWYETDFRNEGSPPKTSGASSGSAAASPT
jgi:predicted nucleic acid-binding Zn ribbon protein